MKVNRVWAMPSRWTFQIPPIAELVARYVGDGRGWIDPFAGMTSPAEFTNDLNPEVRAQSHMDALDWLQGLPGQYQGVIFDPPYSYQQMMECYEAIGTGKITSRHATNFYGDLRYAIAPLIAPGGLALSFGWNSIGQGKTHGFEIIEVLLVCHGRAHNDTICTVERKVKGHLYLKGRQDRETAKTMYSGGILGACEDFSPNSVEGIDWAGMCGECFASYLADSQNDPLTQLLNAMDEVDQSLCSPCSHPETYGHLPECGLGQAKRNLRMLREELRPVSVKP